MKVFLQSIVLQLLLTPLIGWRGCRALPEGKRFRLPYVLLLALELCLYLTGFLLHNVLPDRVMVGIMWVCNTWYVASIYVALSLLMLEALCLSNRLLDWFPLWIRAHWARVKGISFVVVMLGVSLLMVQAYYAATHPRVVHLHLDIPKTVSGRDSLTIVLMSDLHIGEMIGRDLVQRFVTISNAQRPDMVVLAGDIMDYESRFAEMAHAEEALQQLQAPLGTYIVYGNHEYRANREAKRRWLMQTGGVLLIDSVVQPDSLFYLIGRDDYTNRHRQPLHALMQGLDTTKPLIVLDHQPWTLSEQAMNGVDLGLHGHTHGGQLWPNSLVMRLVYECAHGYYRKGGTQYVVSSGIGFAGPPYRVGTRSELVVLHLRFTSSWR
jgi:predicted MPP superfamily phosphohydrolase